MIQQTTLGGVIELSGKGLHTGLEINLKLKPAPADTGYVIIRVDLDEPVEIPALADYVTQTTRGTVLTKGDAHVSTVEHGLAALYASGIDNCIIEVDAPEFPIFEGSATVYMQKIEEVGIEKQKKAKDFFVVRKKRTFVLPDSQSTITLLPDDSFSAQVLIGYDSPVLSNQFASLESLEDFTTEIAPCRTFVFVRELEPLMKMNLIKGGDLDNAIVIYDQEVAEGELERIADLMGQKLPSNPKLGYLNTDLKFNNEPARHKLLDLIGDLALIGKPIKGRVIASYPGHSTNTALAKQIRKDIKRQEVATPTYNPDKEPVMDINRIKELLPHRYPFLLVDKIIELTEDGIIGIKNVTYNEMQFIGHFPEEPVMPGVLIIESMAQCAGILVLNDIEDPQNYSTYFLKIDNVKFRQKVVPGDTLVMKIVFLTPVRRGLANIKGYAFVGDKIVTEAEMTAQIVKNKG